IGSVVAVEIMNIDGQRSEPFVLRIGSPPEPRFVRGDANGDGSLDISDPVSTLGYLFLGNTATCLDALDVDDDGDLALTDAVVALSFLFQGGTEPAPPFPDPGTDPTPDSLGCESGV